MYLESCLLCVDICCSVLCCDVCCYVSFRFVDSCGVPFVSARIGGGAQVSPSGLRTPPESVACRALECDLPFGPRVFFSLFCFDFARGLEKL